MIREQILELNEAHGDNSVIFLEPETYDAGVVGIGETDGVPHLVYSYEKLVKALAENDFKDSDEPETDAVEWIENKEIKTPAKPLVLGVIPLYATTGAGDVKLPEVENGSV